MAFGVYAVKSFGWNISQPSRSHRKPHAEPLEIDTDEIRDGSVTTL